MKLVKVVAAIICDEYPKVSKIFITQRGYGEYKGFWEFPGGKIEQGETAKEALTREIQEELRTEIEVKNLLDTIEYDYPDFHLSMQCYVCTFGSQNYELKEHLSCQWITKKELDKIKWLPADYQLIPALERIFN